MTNDGGPTPTHRIRFRLIDGETTEQLVNAERVTHNVYPDRGYDAVGTLRRDLEAKLVDGNGVFDYTLTQKYGGNHMIPVRHVLWLKLEELGETTSRPS